MSSVLKALIGFLSKLFSRSGGQERPSPGNWINENVKIKLSKEFLTVALTADPITVLAPVADKNSMDPVFDAENRIIIIQGANDADQAALIDALEVGDIAVYQVGTDYIVHRIAEIGSDQYGKWFRFLGDNNENVKDPYYLRAVNIKYVQVGTIY